LVSINKLVTLVEEIGGAKLKREYDLDAPKGVAGRNSDNRMIRKILNWEPKTTLRDGLKATYKWIEQQYMARKAGRKIVD
jgi:nucleoside-diphosphate-sugar epimerase